VSAFVLVITLLSGFIPRSSYLRFSLSLRSRGDSHTATAAKNARKGLVILQFTISTVLLISILTVHQQMKFIRQSPLGYKSDGIVTVDFHGEADVQKKYQAIRNELLSASHVMQVARHSANVVGGLGNGWITTEICKARK